MLAMSVATMALVASAGAFAGSVKSVQASRQLTEAAVFAETIIEDVAAQEYANLLLLDGNVLIDGADAASSQFEAELTVFQAAVGLIQVRVVVTDARTGRELGRVTTVRSSQ
jgi:hypothetical protein